jgi:small Trp-rich protein
MWLLWFALIVLLLRYFEIGWFATLSWWWVSVPFIASFIWFEFIEKRLGLEKKKAMDEMEAAKKARIKRALDNDLSKRRPK